MKKIFTLLLACICVLYLVGCVNRVSENPSASVVKTAEDADPSRWNVPTSPNTPPRLIVNGQDITEGNHVVINHKRKNAEIPVLAVFRALGFDAQMQADENGIPQPIIDGSTRLFDASLPGFGFVTPNEKEGHIRLVTDDDFIIDTNSIDTLLYWGWDIDIQVDFEENIIYIDQFDSTQYERHPAKLIVNGKDISQGNEAYIRFYYQTTAEEIPLLAIAKELGAQVIWEENSLVTIRNRDKEITLDLTQDEFGYMAAPGGISIRKATGTEIYMEFYSANSILKYLANAQISVNEESLIISVTS